MMDAKLSIWEDFEILKLFLGPKEISRLATKSLLSGQLQVTKMEILGVYVPFPIRPVYPVIASYPLKVLLKENLNTPYGVEMLGPFDMNRAVWELHLDQRPYASLTKNGVFIGAYDKVKRIEIRKK